jgi:hypothetical protein
MTETVTTHVQTSLPQASICSRQIGLIPAVRCRGRWLMTTSAYLVGIGKLVRLTNGQDRARLHVAFVL